MHVRGRYTLNTQLKLTVEQPEQASNRARRSAAMAARYYFYHSLCGYRYERCLHELWNEFYLAHDTIIDILLNAQATITELTANQTTVQQLAAKYPHLTWKNNQK